MSESKINRAINNQIRGEIKGAASNWLKAYCNKKSTAQPLDDLFNSTCKLDGKCFTASQRACLCPHLDPETMLDMIISLEPNATCIAEHIAALCQVWLYLDECSNRAMRRKFQDALIRSAMFANAAQKGAA